MRDAGGKKSQENQSQALIQALVELSVLSCSDRRGKVKLTKALIQALHHSVVSFSKRGTVGAEQLTERKKHITKQALKETHHTGGGRAKREQSQATRGYNHKRIKLGSSLKHRQAKITFM